MLILCIILHLAPIRADLADCNIVMPWIHAAARGTLQSSAGTVLCITLPPTGRNFIISRCISSLAYLLSSGIRDPRGLVWPRQPIRGQYCPRWPMRGRPDIALHWPLVSDSGWAGLPPLLAWCRHCRGPGSPAWPGCCTGSSEFVLVSSAQLKMRIRGLNRFSSHPASTLPLNNPASQRNR